jgi:hypothetical protein
MMRWNLSWLAYALHICVMFGTLQRQKNVDRKMVVYAGCYLEGPQNASQQGLQLQAAASADALPFAAVKSPSSLCHMFSARCGHEGAAAGTTTGFT